MTSTRQMMTQEVLDELISQCVADALATYDVNQNNGDDSRSHDSGSGKRRTVHTTRLAYWFEKMEYVFHISNRAIECQVKYATCTLLGNVLTWWNSHVRIVGHDTTYGMPWKTLMKMMTENYCPMSKIKKLEIELWNLKVKSTDVGCVMSTTLQEAIELAKDLMDQKVCTYAERQADNKRRFDNNPRDNHDQQPSYKRQNVARAYTAGPGEKKVSSTAANNQRTLTCFDCGNQGHYKSDCPKLKNQNCRNQAGSSEARGRVYALGGGEAD
ncbi:putative reverse transcriptase domain-containing protein [Tanacetum coccineum]|uniref:Reverse transcriptase domain-containing protein n=1 Tax=Tanacetum coccineum TaxID=301880 RepID=A0ABQ5E3G5_9ASTR